MYMIWILSFYLGKHLKNTSQSPVISLKQVFNTRFLCIQHEKSERSRSAKEGQLAENGQPLQIARCTLFFKVFPFRGYIMVRRCKPLLLYLATSCQLPCLYIAWSNAVGKWNIRFWSLKSSRCTSKTAKILDNWLRTLTMQGPSMAFGPNCVVKQGMTQK